MVKRAVERRDGERWASFANVRKREKAVKD